MNVSDFNIQREKKKKWKDISDGGRACERNRATGEKKEHFRV
jgi:hypothetical protein